MTEEEKRIKTEEQTQSPTQASPSSQPETTSPPIKPEEAKILIRLKNAGNAPILKNSKMFLSGNDKFARIISYLKKGMKGSSIYLYINSTFSPSPSALIKDLYQCFRVQDELIVNYALTEAWG